MQRRTRNIIFALCATATVGSLIAFAATGAHPYTRFRDKEIEAANTQTDLTDLFTESGTPHEAPPAAVDSVNAIGLLPSGPGMASISVATIAGPAFGVAGLAWWLGRRRCTECAAGAGDACPPSRT